MASELRLEWRETTLIGAWSRDNAAICGAELDVWGEPANGYGWAVRHGANGVAADRAAAKLAAEAAALAWLSEGVAALGGRVVMKLGGST